MSAHYNHNYQQGVGLVEVLVAVMLLAVAVLGFSALQLRAVKATDESLIRTQAMSVVRSLAENMRETPEAIDTYQSVINDPSEAGTITRSSCQTLQDRCTAQQIAAKSSLASKAQASSHGISLQVSDCPGTSDFAAIKCIVAAWGETTATMGSDAQACADAQGIYNINATCVIVEAY